MDKPLPPDFDPTKLVDEPMDPVEQPSKRNEADHQNASPPGNRSGHVEELMHFVPASLKRFIVAGSCCTGVAALYFITSWDHGWIPGVKSQLAQSSDLDKTNEEINKSKQEIASMKSDLKEMYVLDIARAIRDLQAELCEGWTRAKADRLDELQYKYESRTGSRYPERQRC